MTSLTQFLGFSLVALLLPLAGEAGEVPGSETYVPTVAQIEKHKAFYDDPRPLLNTFGPKQVLPPELYAKLTYDIEEMKERWAEVVGFRAPDVVGAIAPEIKPGNYTYTDLEQSPGFKNLMWPNLYDRIKPGEPPFAGSIPEFEIIPTRHFLGITHRFGDQTERGEIKIRPGWISYPGDMGRWLSFSSAVRRF